MGRPGEAVIFRNTRVYAYMPRDFTSTPTTTAA